VAYFTKHYESEITDPGLRASIDRGTAERLLPRLRRARTLEPTA
jgi:hypothetical protein